MYNASFTRGDAVTPRYPQGASISIILASIRSQCIEHNRVPPVPLNSLTRLQLAPILARLKREGLHAGSELVEYLQAIGTGLGEPDAVLSDSEGVSIRLLDAGDVDNEIAQRVTTKSGNTDTRRGFRIAQGEGRQYWVSGAPNSTSVWREYTELGTFVEVAYTLREWLSVNLNLHFLKDANPAVVMEAINDPSTLSTINAVFDHHSDFTVDRRWLAKLITLVSTFEQRSEDHINFLGGNLVGVYRLHWTAEDERQWYEEICNIDDVRDLRTSYHDLDAINPDFNVVGNPLNAAFVYVCHRILTSDLSDVDKEKGGVACISMMHYQFMSSLMYHQFPYRADEAIALALYEQLSRKSLLKQHHTWGNLVRARALDVIGANSIHRDTLLTCGPDERVTYVISDVQSRIREVIKLLKRDFMRLREEDARVMSRSQTAFNEEGETVLREFEDKTDRLQREMRSIVQDKVDFIRPEVVESTLRLVTTADDRHLRTVLGYMADHFSDRKTPEIPQLVERLVLFIQDYRRKAASHESSVAHIVLKVRNLMRSSQLNNVEAVEMRNLGTLIVEKALPKRSPTLQASTRIAVFVYVTLRMLTINHFK